MEGDAAYRTRRAPEEKAAARKATHPKAREANLELAQRFDELARSITSSEKSLGLDLVLDPGRKSFASFGSVTEFASGQAGVVENLAEYLTPGEIGSADELQPGEGGIARRNQQDRRLPYQRRAAGAPLGSVHAHGLHRALEFVREMLGLSLSRIPIRAGR
jgi:hypothetical protein